MGILGGWDERSGTVDGYAGLSLGFGLTRSSFFVLRMIVFVPFTLLPMDGELNSNGCGLPSGSASHVDMVAEPRPSR